MPHPLSQRYFALTVSACLLLLAAESVVPAFAFEELEVPQPAGRRAPVAAAGQMVPLPHVMRDAMGNTWDVQHDGAIGDGGNDLYDGGGHLSVGGATYQSAQPQAQFDPAANELVLAPMPMSGLTVHRRVAVNAAQSWCRWTEVLENPTGAAVRANLRVNFDMGGGVQQFQPVRDERKGTDLGMALSDGRRAFVMMSAGPGSKVVGTWQTQQGTDQVNLTFDVDVPARRTVALVHFQAVRPTTNDVVAFMQQAKDKELLDGIPKDLRRAIANFRVAAGLTLAGLELPRAELLDTVELRTGDRYRGTLADAAFKLDTFHGPVELPADRVLGMVTAGTYRPAQLFVTRDGEVVGGTLGRGADAIRLQLSSGQWVNLPLSDVTKIGCRKRPGEPEEFKLDKPMAFLQDGQRLIVDAPAADVPVTTVCGTVSLKPEWVASITLRGEEHAVHQVRLRDGSRFSGVVGGDSIDLRLAGATVAAGGGSSGSAERRGAVRFPLASIVRLQLVATPEDAGDADDVPALTLANGDLLVGTAAGTLELDTGFDVLRLAGDEVRGLRPAEVPDGRRGNPGEVTVTMWDGANISGRLKGDGVEFAPRSGRPVRVPVGLVARYAHPTPTPPPELLERIKATVRDLSNDDWKTRDRAAEQLRSLGQSAVAVLRPMRDGQPPEAQKMIDTILKALEGEKAAASKGAGGRPAAAAPPPVQPMMR